MFGIETTHPIIETTLLKGFDTNIISTKPEILEKKKAYSKNRAEHP